MSQLGKSVHVSNIGLTIQSIRVISIFSFLFLSSANMESWGENRTSKRNHTIYKYESDEFLLNKEGTLISLKQQNDFTEIFFCFYAKSKDWSRFIPHKVLLWTTDSLWIPLMNVHRKRLQEVSYSALILKPRRMWKYFY